MTAREQRDLGRLAFAARAHDPNAHYAVVVACAEDERIIIIAVAAARTLGTLGRRS